MVWRLTQLQRGLVAIWLSCSGFVFRDFAVGTIDFAIGRWRGRFDGVPLERDGVVSQGAVDFGGSVGGVRAEPELDGLAQCVVGLGGDGLLGVDDALEPEFPLR